MIPRGTPDRVSVVCFMHDTGHGDLQKLIMMTNPALTNCNFTDRRIKTSCEAHVPQFVKSNHMQQKNQNTSLRNLCLEINLTAR